MSSLSLSMSKISIARVQTIRKAALLVAALLGVAVFALTDSVYPDGQTVHEMIEWAGMILIIVCILGRTWTSLYIGGRKSAEVVDIGPYSMSRNPLYFFSTIAAAGVGAQIGSWVMGVIFALLCWAAFTIVIRREERFLSDSLGQNYLDYTARTPRFFPNPLLYKDRREVTFKPKLFNQTLIDGLVFLAAIPAFELIEYWQESGLIPVLLRLP